MKSLILTLTILLFSDNLYSDDRDLIKLASTDMRQAQEVLKTLQEKARQKEIVYRVIACESSFRHDNIWGDNGKSYGLFQFQYPTFKELAGKMGFKGAKWKDAKHQYIVASWALNNGHGRHWACYEKKLHPSWERL